MAFVYRVIWAILLLLTFFDALMAYDGPKEAKIKVEILDSTYQFAGKGITFNTFDMRFSSVSLPTTGALSAYLTLLTVIQL